MAFISDDAPETEPGTHTAHLMSRYHWSQGSLAAVGTHSDPLWVGQEMEPVTHAHPWVTETE